MMVSNNWFEKLNTGRVFNYMKSKTVVHLYGTCKMTTTATRVLNILPGKFAICAIWKFDPNFIALSEAEQNDLEVKFKKYYYYPFLYSHKHNI